jgi:hypothetical protein
MMMQYFLNRIKPLLKRTENPVLNSQKYRNLRIRLSAKGLNSKRLKIKLEN